mgnify:CR=1 FL=1
MALINCPECGKEVSDKVKACPHCGFPFEVSAVMEKEPQKVEITSVNIKPGETNVKKILIGVASVLLLLAIGITMVTIVNKNKETQAYNSYIDNLELAMKTMLEGGVDAETLSNLTAKVWSNAIFKERDFETDEFTMSPSGVYYEDFNIALGGLFSNNKTKTTISNIEANQKKVELIMKELQNPPKGLETCYQTVSELYTAYSGFTNLAIHPTGSLQTYSESRVDKDNQFMDIFNKLKTQIPDKK